MKSLFNFISYQYRFQLHHHDHYRTSRSFPARLVKVVSISVRRIISNHSHTHILGDNMEPQFSHAQKAIDVYNRLIKYPDAVSARISRLSCGNQTIVRTQWSQHDLEKMETIKFYRDYSLSQQESKVTVNFISPNTEAVSEIWNVESPTGDQVAIVKKTTKNGDDKFYIEIWNKTHKYKTIDLSSQEKHGKVYENDETFGSFAWSNSGKSLLYVAEKKLPKSVSYFKKTNSDKDDSTTKGNEHFYKEDWGEQMTGKHLSVLCVVDIDTEEIKVLDKLPQQYFVGKACWAPGDAGVVFLGWVIDPYRLGIIYCPIRECTIFYFDFKSEELQTISETGNNCRSVRVSPDSKKLVYLENDAFGPHCQGSQLMMYDWQSKSTSVVTDLVRVPKGDEFPGLYLQSLPKNCWSLDSSKVFCSSLWRSNLSCVAIDVNTKEVTRMSKAPGECRVLDVYNNKVVVSCSAPDQPPHMCIGDLSQSSGNLDLTPLDGEPLTFSEFKYEVMNFEPTDERAHQEYGKLPYEGYLVTPCEGKQHPLIVFSHGGPHTQFPTSYMMYTAGFALCGYAILMVNYRGSTGFGEDNLRSLPGNIGDMDVRDIQTAAESVVKSGRVDASKVAAFGGSHGGFLTTHLIAQYPDFYHAACCRNPVVNITSMMGTSDIPDWTCVEAGISHTCVDTPNAEMLTTLWEKSPMSLIDNVKAPVQIMLGLDDRRVPPKQGEQYYKLLKARKIPTRLVTYEGNCHPLVKPASQSDSFVNTVAWFNFHLDV